MMNASDLQTLEEYAYWSHILYESLHLPILFFDEQLSLQVTAPENTIVSLNIQDLLSRFEILNEPTNVPVMHKVSANERLVTLVVRNPEQAAGVFVFGPCQDGLEMERVQQAHELSPIISRQELLNKVVLMTSLFTANKLSVLDVVDRESDPVTVTRATNDSIYEVELFKNRQDSSFHATYQSERMTLRCVKEGQTEALLQRLDMAERDGRIGVLSKQSSLRNEKNLHISTVTLATRYAIEGGLHPETAYTMSDHYIQAAEELRSTDDVQRCTREALCEFADRVNKANHLRYSAPIIKCQSYVFKQLYEDLSLKRVAQFVGLHPNYLSSLFKKEVGLSFTEYVLREKVTEAKKLLKYTDDPISEIYTWLNFHDQSHFTKVFKQYTGMTPKQFKSREAMTAL